MAAAGGGALQPLQRRARGGTSRGSGAVRLRASNCPARCTPRTKYPACDAEIPSALDGFYSVLAFAASVGDAPRAKLTFFSARATFSVSVGDALTNQFQAKQ